MGSLYTSIIPSLVCKGVGPAIAALEPRLPPLPPAPLPRKTHRTNATAETAISDGATSGELDRKRGSPVCRFGPSLIPSAPVRSFQLFLDVSALCWSFAALLAGKGEGRVSIRVRVDKWW